MDSQASIISTNRVSSERMQAVHWHQGKEPSTSEVDGIIDEKNVLAVYSGIVRSYEGEVLPPRLMCVQ